MNTNKELLALAAKAAGYSPAVVTDDGVVILRGVRVKWNPLEDDGDAMRLAVALRMALSCGSHLRRCWAEHEKVGAFFGQWELFNGDENKAMRYAITRCAAEIGKAMP